MQLLARLSPRVATASDEERTQRPSSPGQSSGKLGVPTFAVRTGGFSDTELRDAGAIAVYDSLSGLQADLDQIIAAN